MDCDFETVVCHNRPDMKRYLYNLSLGFIQLKRNVSEFNRVSKE